MAEQQGRSGKSMALGIGASIEPMLRVSMGQKSRQTVSTSFQTHYSVSCWSRTASSVRIALTGQ